MSDGENGPGSTDLRRVAAGHGRGDRDGGSGCLGYLLLDVFLLLILGIVRRSDAPALAREALPVAIGGTPLHVRLDR